MGFYKHYNLVNKYYFYCIHARVALIMSVYNGVNCVCVLLNGLSQAVQSRVKIINPGLVQNLNSDVQG